MSHAQKGSIISLLTIAAVSALFAISTISAHADTVNVNFESPYVPGSVNGQDGWVESNASYDQAVVTNTYGYSDFGSQAFRISDATASGAFDWVFAKPLTDGVGESSATAGSFSTGTRQNHFEMIFDIASAVPTAQQPGLHVSVSPDRGDGSRMSYLRFEDGASGIDVFFDDVQNAASPANFVETQIASGLDRTVKHTVRLTMDTPEGASNDVVRVYIDGALVHTGTSWENYFRYDSEASAEQSPRIVKTMIIQARGASTPANAGNGFLFDNIQLSSSQSVAPATVYVDDSYSSTIGTTTADNHTVGVDAFTTIQAGIDAVADGGTVHVADGTYSEQVVITKALTLTGAGASTVIQSPASLANSYTIDSKSMKPVVVDIGHDVTISDLKIDGNGQGSANNYFVGLAIQNAAATVDGVTITGVRDNPLAGSQHGVGLYVQNQDGTARTITIKNSVISDYQKNAIDLKGPSLTVDISGNTITGAGDITTLAQNGIVVFSGVSGSITGNTVSNHEYSGSLGGADPMTKTQSTGILLYNADDGLELSGNTVSNNDIGIYNLLNGVGTTTIRSNTLTDNRYEGIAQDAGIGSVTNNTISGGNIGLALLSFNGNSMNSRVYASGNTISGTADSAIKLLDENSGDTVTTSLTAQNNSISANAAGVNDTTGNTSDAVSNWWGNASGPTNTANNPDGTGNSVTDNVTFTPWYSDAAMTQLHYNATNTGTDVRTTTSADTSDTTSTTAGDVTMDIPSGTTIIGSTSWDGTLHAPTVIASTTPSVPGQTTTPVLTIQVGSEESQLSFSQPVRLLFEGQAGKEIGWQFGNGSFNPITTACGSDSSGGFPTNNNECKINVGGDLAVWTKHFTTFTVYTQVATQSNLNNGSGGGGGGGGSSNGPVSGGGGGTAAVALPNNGGGSATGGSTQSSGSVSGGGQVLGAATYNFTTDLTIGSRGTDVTELQKLLIAAGFDIPAGATGYFGAQTRAAVSKYQAAHGITPTAGYVGVKTRAVLNAGTTPTMSDEQRSMLITQLTLQLNELMAKINAMMSGTTQ